MKTTNNVTIILRLYRQIQQSAIAKEDSSLEFEYK